VEHTVIMAEHGNIPTPPMVNRSLPPEPQALVKARKRTVGMNASHVLSALLPIFFVASGLFAASVLMLTWKAYGAELQAIRRQLADLDDERDFSVRIALTETREFIAAPRRSAIKPKAARRLRLQPALRAAA